MLQALLKGTILIGLLVKIQADVSQEKLIEAWQDRQRFDVIFVGGNDSLREIQYLMQNSKIPISNQDSSYETKHVKLECSDKKPSWEENYKANLYWISPSSEMEASNMLKSSLK